MTEVNKTGNFEFDNNNRYHKSACVLCLMDLIRMMDNDKKVNNYKCYQPSQFGYFSHTDSSLRLSL
jgi:hypothetical protein